MTNTWGWRYTGKDRPSFAEKPGPGQESVWDYPRPPRREVDPRRVVVRLGETLVAETDRAVRVLETASPPTFYLPPADVRSELLRPAAGSSYCEWKGQASYLDVVVAGATLARAAWTYLQPLPEFAEIRGFVAFYPAMLECFVGEHRVLPQPGRFYGGWITPELVGPFKGEPGSGGW